MRRTKQWWAHLTKEERSELVYLERAQYKYGSGWNLPEGYSDCSACGYPCTGSICAMCSNRLSELVRKADKAEAKRRGLPWED